MMSRKFPLILVPVGLVFIAGCGRTELGVSVHVAAGEVDAAKAASGPCGEATCLTSLFRTCVPEGSCTLGGAGGPHTSVSFMCYSNGVKVTSQGGWNGTNVYRELTVRRDDTTCYDVVAAESPSGEGTTYVITGPGGKQVATGTTDLGTKAITVTCTGAKPTVINDACLQPVEDSGSACDTTTGCP
jgi:hypothetical protein